MPLVLQSLPVLLAGALVTLGFSVSAMGLGLVLGFLVESNFRRSLVLSGDNYMIFVDDRISLVLLIFSALFIFGSLGRRALAAIRKENRVGFSEGSGS